ncbi:hypothetical protein WR25_06964 [Diploscapter pachys]|uniref:Uncharacterized protein n=1 Tax=Diploscapter pachys TaxID=2018661 RepID=A0A2A2K3K5_9BILA|nr:hypothetical protein WR25_06964 [Diploscapter pachys]
MVKVDKIVDPVPGMDVLSACVMSSIKGNADMLRQLLDDGEDVDSRDEAGRTPLRLAAAIDTDPYQVADLLLSRGANVDASCTNSFTPLMVAAGRNNANVVERLLEAGASTKKVDSLGMNALHHAVLNFSCNPIVKMLCDADPKMTTVADTNNCLPIHYAASKAHPEVCILLLEKMDRNCVPSTGSPLQLTPFHFSAKDGNPTAIEAMLHFYKARLSSSSPEGSKIRSDVPFGPLISLDSRHNIPLHYAMKYGHLECVKALLHLPNSEACLRYANKDGSTPLHLGAANGHLECLRYIESKFPNHYFINERDKMGRTPAMLCLTSYQKELLPTNHSLVDVNGRGFLHRAVYAENIKQIRELILDKHLNVNLRDSNGTTALHLAAAKGSLPLVQLLIDCGAVINEKDRRGMTPADWAAAKQNIEVLDFLVDCVSPSTSSDRSEGKLTFSFICLRTCFQHVFAHFSARDPFDRTALHLAVFSGDVSSAQFLFESVSDEADRAALLNALDCDGRTPLMYSVFYPESLACLDWLLSEGADVSVQDKSGYNVLHYACNHSNEAAALQLAEFLEVNESKYAVSISNMQNGDGQTPLHIAIKRNLLEFVKQFAPLAQISMYTKDNYGRLPVNAAIEDDRMAECIEVLFVLSFSTNDSEKSGSVEVGELRKSLSKLQFTPQKKNSEQRSSISNMRSLLNEFDSDEHASVSGTKSPSQSTPTNHKSDSYVPRLNLTPTKAPRARHSDILPSASLSLSSPLIHSGSLSADSSPSLRPHGSLDSSAAANLLDINSDDFY